MVDVLPTVHICILLFLFLSYAVMKLIKGFYRHSVILEEFIYGYARIFALWLVYII